MADQQEEIELDTLDNSVRVDVGWRVTESLWRAHMFEHVLSGRLELMVDHMLERRKTKV